MAYIVFDTGIPDHVLWGNCAGLDYYFTVKEKGYPDSFQDTSTGWTIYFRRHADVWIDSAEKSIQINVPDQGVIEEKLGAFASSEEAIRLLLDKFNRKYGNNKETE